MDNQFDSELVIGLETLPIDVGKVFLWLVYRGIKPMASIVLDFDWGKDKNKERQILDWFEKTGIYFANSQRFTNTLHVSLDSQVLETNRKFELDELTKAHQLRGELYGIPKEAAKIYGEEIVKPNPFPNKRLIHAPMVEGLIGKYWYPYIEYLLRRGHELEDSMVAKSWADVARKEIPEVAKNYEKSRLGDLVSHKEQLEKIYK